ncbi:MAG: CarD family transcriptional regulator [Woeseiaceae bacterium]|nr:CarD family transcriptional regulator [Woeseiaceae bacterium]
MLLPGAGVALISEQQLFGEKVRQRSRRRRTERDPEAIIRQLNDLQPGSPVVHAEYGVGRYLGLVMLEAGGTRGEFLHLEYADGDQLYVPVQALDRISRYTGASPEHAPLHRLGTDQWAKAKKRAVQKIRDVAGGSTRASMPGAPHAAAMRFAGPKPTTARSRTPSPRAHRGPGAYDRRRARGSRLRCADGSGRLWGCQASARRGRWPCALRHLPPCMVAEQVAILVPTTLLAQQHAQTFKDRFADWPVQIEVLSRFVVRKGNGGRGRGHALGQRRRRHRHAPPVAAHTRFQERRPGYRR